MVEMKTQKWFRESLVIAFVFILALVLMLSTTHLSQASDGRTVNAYEHIQRYSPEVIGPFIPTSYDGDLRDLPQVPESGGGVVPNQVVPNGKTPPVEPGFLDPVAQTWQGESRMPDPGITFEGMSRNDSGGWIPPDTNGEVGPNHYIQTVNVAIGIFDKTTGAALLKISFNSFFASAPSPCNVDHNGDVIVLYDHLADRWLISDFQLSVTPTYQCIAVSKTGDPVSGGWWFYGLPASNAQGSWQDYPKLSVWPNAYFLTANMFDPWEGAKVWALDRAKMLVGDPMTAQTVDLGQNYGSLLPGNLEGPTPPDGAPGYFASIEFLSTLHLWRYFVDWDVPSNSHFDGPFDLQVADFGYIGDIPQPAPGSNVDSLGDRLMMQLQYRNFGDHEALWVNHTVASGDVAGVRWYEARDPAGTPYVYQQGTYQPDDTYRWMGSLAVDRDGNMALGYSASSTSVKPAIRYAGRLNGEILGTLPQAENSIIEGTGVQVGESRWGDYSAMSVDPVDDCTFWYTQEYLALNGSSWQTRIGSFKFPSCGAEKGYLGGTVYDSISGNPIADAIVVAEGISATLTTQTDSSGYFTVTLPADVYTLTASTSLPGYPNPTVVLGVNLEVGAHLNQDIPLVPYPAIVGVSNLIDDNVPGGNGNGYVEPGESSILLYETVTNIGATDATTITAQLASLTPGVVVVSPTSTYPNLAVNDSQTNDFPFVISIAPTVTCGSRADFMEVLTTGQGEFSVLFSIKLDKPLPRTSLFADDMESGVGGWVTGGTNNTWALTTVKYNSPTHSWTDSPAGQYLNNTNSWLRSPIFDLTNKDSFVLDFWHQYSMEFGYDFLYVEYSLDGGATWMKLNSGYTGAQTTWTEETYDLAVVDNQSSVAFRYRLESDAGVTDDGWYIDDVSLSYVPFECTYLSELPAVPTLLSPENDAILSSSAVTLTWQAGVGGNVEGYQLELDGSVYTTTDSYKAVTLDPGVHNWRVLAYNELGASEYSDMWSFEIVFIPGVPTLISPANGATTSSPVTFEWEDSGTGGVPTGYIFMLDGTPVITFTTPITTSTIELTPGPHTWSVAAYNEGGQSEFTDFWTVNIFYRIFLPLLARN